MKKRPKTGVKEDFFFGQAPPKHYQNHHLDPISLLMDGSESVLLKPRSGSAIKTRIHPDPDPKH